MKNGKGGLCLKAYILRKIILHGCVSAAVCVLLGLFSRGGRLYAGFGAAFLGAAYLLAAWLRWLKAGGTDLLRLLKRREARQVPYFHQRDKQKTPGAWPGRGKFPYEDSLDSERQQKDSVLPAQARLRGDAAAFGLCGAVLLAVSLFI